MNYKKCYKKIVNKAKNRKLEPNIYTEKHHIIPKCMNGDESEQNIVKLTAKEHYVVHHLLTKIYENTKYISKLICAFRFMTVDSHNGNRIGLKDYEYMRSMYSINHPMKNKKTSAKVSRALKKYYKNISKKDRKIINDKIIKSLEKYYKKLSVEEYQKMSEKHKKIANSIKQKILLGIKKYYDNETKKQKKSRLEKQKKAHTKESYKKTSTSIKKFIDNLNTDEKTNRLKKSLWSGDNIKRGISISKGKKGKKTNQQQIMGEKYANMSDLEFFTFLNTKSEKKNIRNRMISLRNKYLTRKN